MVDHGPVKHLIEVVASAAFAPKDPTAPTIVAALLSGMVTVVMFLGDLAAEEWARSP